MTNVEKMWKAIEEAEMESDASKRCYSMGFGELKALANKGKEEAFTAICNAFDYGFIKGMRYQKAQEKKKESGQGVKD